MEVDYQDAIKKIEAHYGSREAFLGQMLIRLSMTGQPCDITFYKRHPLLDVKIDQQLGLALAYGAGAAKIAELFSQIRLSTGSTVNLPEIWTVNPMPEGGISAVDLDATDLSEGDVKAGPNGETVRQMIRDTYKCENLEEEEKYLRRFIAS